MVAPAFYFVWRRDLPALRHFVLVVMTTFVVCYLVFIFFPVAGPYYVFPRPDAVVHRQRLRPHGVRHPRHRQLLRRGVPQLARRGDGRRRALRRPGLEADSAWALALPTVLLTVAVVYCQMHYGVDAVAGLLVGMVVAAAVESA